MRRLQNDVGCDIWTTAVFGDGLFLLNVLPAMQPDKTQFPPFSYQPHGEETTLSPLRLLFSWLLSTLLLHLS